jgi:hypothetical protein
VALTLSAPSGWTAQATSPSTFATVAPGQTATTTWSVTVPAGASPGSYGVTAQATFTSVNGQGASSDAATVALPYSSFTAAYNNTGISNDSATSAANFDGGGLSLSAQALAAATPSLTPGGAFTHDGLSFTWPNAQAGTPDNVVALGQTIALSGSGTTLGLVGDGDYGSASDIATITYTDGSTQTFNLGYADWWANSPTVGDDILTSLPYINNETGQQTQKVSVYYASVPLQAGKTVRYLTLPNIGPASANGLAMHIFAVSIG